MLRSRAFFAAENLGSRVQGPVEFVAGQPAVGAETLGGDQQHLAAAGKIRVAQPDERSHGRDAVLLQAGHAAVGQAFDRLAHTVLSSNARTLEDLVREMLRPMLKNWLDDNLPTMVERLVRAEIERVARGGR